MAYDVEVTQYVKMGSVPGGFPSIHPEGPPLAHAQVVAAGKVVVSPTARFIRIRNRAGSQAINWRFQNATDGVNATAANGFQMAVSGPDLWVAVPKLQPAGGFEIDIR